MRLSFRIRKMIADIIVELHKLRIALVTGVEFIASYIISGEDVAEAGWESLCVKMEDGFFWINEEIINRVRRWIRWE